MLQELYSYQKKTALDVFHSFANHKAVMMAMPTGSGKTITYTYIAEQFIKNGKRVCIVAHKKDLIAQVAKSVSRYIPARNIGLITPTAPYEPHKLVQVCSIQTLHSRKAKLAKFIRAQDILIIEEAHHSVASTYIDIITMTKPECYILGVTATPYRLDDIGFDYYINNKKEKTPLFTDLIENISIKQLEEQGFLCRGKVLSLINVDFDKIKEIGERNKYSEYTDEELDIHVNKTKVNKDAVAAYLQFGNNGIAVTFCCSLEHSESVYDEYTKAGVSAAHIGSNYCIDQYGNYTDRETILQRWKVGEIKVLCNRDIAIEGIDNPAITVGQMLRPIKSLSGAMQMFGRCTRTFKGKTGYLILDHVGVCQMHGAPNADRHWQLQGESYFEINATIPQNDIASLFTKLITRHDKYQAYVLAKEFCKQPIEPYHLVEIAKKGNFTENWLKTQLLEIKKAQAL